jgi:hypothetical protein
MLILPSPLTILGGEGAISQGRASLLVDRRYLVLSASIRLIIDLSHASETTMGWNGAGVDEGMGKQA